MSLIFIEKARVYFFSSFSDEIIDFRRSVTVPVIDAEMDEANTVPNLEDQGRTIDVDHTSVRAEQALLLNENETKSTGTIE